MWKLMLLWFVSLVVVAGLASGLTFAQTRPLILQELANARILSGADIGFRVEGTNRTGEPVGRLMVRVNGNWVEPGWSTKVVPAR
jgi:hypothetical protein